MLLISLCLNVFRINKCFICNNVNTSPFFFFLRYILYLASFPSTSFQNSAILLLVTIYFFYSFSSFARLQFKLFLFLYYIHFIARI
ncbi:hypothetical protein C2G38_2066166 [Gigaspora rosea]|uniref:Uncharacterized protein n=1 Tax=Gigaspora rosea TaxID=44941 RepID=A0A397W109_9GLOM|nr:hypothetical protein C2G38_2066166 [Gigaspora rosea]